MERDEVEETVESLSAIASSTEIASTGAEGGDGDAPDTVYAYMYASSIVFRPMYDGS
jgi:hypothetical protein